MLAAPMAAVADQRPIAEENAAARPGQFDNELRMRALRDAAELSRLRTLIVARHGKPLIERRFRGPGLDVPVNVKSISKSIVSALVGATIARGVLESTNQPISGLLADKLPRQPDPRLRAVTIGHLLSMRSGLERTSGRNYGRWVASPDWVRAALSRPFIGEPGGRMLYSTGNFHLISAILTRASGRTTHALVRDWLAKPLGVRVSPWQKDPQGIFFGGNNMALSPRSLLRFGEMYRNGGVHAGRRILPQSWIRESWRPRTRSPYSGDAYGYGWFSTNICGQTAHYARGFGGQFLYVIPALALTIVLTSDPTIHTRVDNYRGRLRALAAGLVAAALRADAKDGVCG